MYATYIHNNFRLLLIMEAHSEIYLYGDMQADQ